ncbi:alpha/beta fold hydrolase [Streptomyces clavuligerus]|nr:alpha/beta hydrolase [Streptomyces clavuligerus]ANW19369.1 hypothetical protein BB341_14650 [Streptomyces clavuligerus]MBY6303947.1 alpha/beta fold hydrolase [Streptomyces clavuligerus]QPL64008.1 alpha/beta fold hydrolase [Streptomyces clavuligerus]QPL70035.1 alpha/beta fold hydrolase [Streptomyces clavuligerus]QPL76119.1 alpha/beta fold hydrolase [Streptomyces clavuligerus]
MATSHLTAVALAAVLTGLDASLPPPDDRSPSRSGAPALEWTGCARTGGPADQECADLTVPLDHTDPGGPAVTVGVSRVPGGRPAAERRGTLLVIAGGPGGSGIKRLAEKGEALRQRTGGRYDLVAMDPRGVGRSTRASCGLGPQDRMLTALRPWPDGAGRIGESTARARRTAEACGRNGGALLRSLSTADQVRDIERFRQALGAEKLSAWGISYGAYVGAVYAQKYPHRTDRWVLDSVGDPDPALVSRAWMANTSQAVEERFPDFARWAADPARENEPGHGDGPGRGDGPGHGRPGGGLRLAERPEDVRPLFLSLAARLDRAPRPSATPGVPLTGNTLRQALHLALYSEAGFAGLARLLQEVQDPRARPVLPAELTAPVPDEDVAVMVAVVCNDVRWPGRIPEYERAVAADRARYPLTAGMPANLLPCAFWKDAPAEEPTRITDDGPSNLLLVQSLRDPATPHFGAVRMREALGRRARMVSVDRGGHGVYLGVGDACSDAAVTRFLTTGERPETDIRCPAPGPARGADG